MIGRLTRLERKLMAAEYLLDSTIMHVRNSKCDDVKPLALKRIELKEAYANLIRNRCDMTQSSLGAFDGRE